MKVFLTIVAIISIILGVVCLYVGFDKVNNYYMSDFGYSTNAYVGGDAYNYIINGTYFTAYAVMGMGCFIIAVLCFGVIGIINATENQNMIIHNKAEELKQVIKSNSAN